MTPDQYCLEQGYPEDIAAFARHAYTVFPGLDWELIYRIERTIRKIEGSDASLPVLAEAIQWAKDGLEFSCLNSIQEERRQAIVYFLEE